MDTVTQTSATPGPGAVLDAVPPPGGPPAGESATTGPGTSADAPVDVCVTGPQGHPRPEGRDHYTISEVAAFTGLTAHTLRWYERIGLMPHIDRSHTGQRRYRNRDLDWLGLVGKLRLTGMAVADMVRFAGLVRDGDHTFPERRVLLEATRREVRHRIAELQDTLAVLDHKIDFYAAASTPVAGDASVPPAARVPGDASVPGDVSASPASPASPEGTLHR